VSTWPFNGIGDAFWWGHCQLNLIVDLLFVIGRREEVFNRASIKILDVLYRVFGSCLRVRSSDLLVLVLPVFKTVSAMRL